MRDRGRVQLAARSVEVVLDGAGREASDDGRLGGSLAHGCPFEAQDFP